MPLTVRRLDAEDDRSHFKSGNVELDRFFLRYAGQNQFRHHIGTTYVALSEHDTIVGFATVTASELSTSTLPATKRKHLPQYPVPVLRLARLAVDDGARRLGVGSALLRFVFALAQRMASDFGCLGVVVDAKPEAIALYEKLGFVALEVGSGQLGDRPEPMPMFLEIGAVPRPTGR